MSRKHFFIVTAISILASAFGSASVAQINAADPDAAQKQSSQLYLPADSTSTAHKQDDTTGAAEGSPSVVGSYATSGESSPVKEQEKNGQYLLIVFPLLVLAGLCFAIFIGRRRRMVNGVMSAPAPGSEKSPIIGNPESEKSKRK